MTEIEELREEIRKLREELSRLQFGPPVVYYHHQAVPMIGGYPIYPGGPLPVMGNTNADNPHFVWRG